MFRFLALLFVILPLAEIWLLFQVGAVIGGWETFWLMILVSLVGAWMVRREGLGIIAKLQGRLAGGELPTKELVDGLLVALAGALMLTPGFVTDAVGLLLVFPPTRIIMRTGLIRRYGSRVQTATAGTSGFESGLATGFGHPQYGDIVDVEDVVDVGEASYERPADPPELTD